jgi:chondroitin sulfate synthase
VVWDFILIETIMVLKLLVAMRLWTFLVGATLSFTIGVWWCRYIVPRPGTLKSRICQELQNAAKPTKPKHLRDEIESRDLLFIGVMTSQKFLTTRAKGVHDTWGNKIPGRLVFFAGKGDTTPGVDFPVVYLTVPDNVHPPQRKSLAMLKYIHDNFIDKFQWFIRADDDVYIRTGRLAAYLRIIDSSEPLLLGQAGQGRKHEKGRLGLRDGDNFCIGGSSIIMSRGVLRMVTPHLEFCLNNTATSHEDTEVGRCLRNFAGVMCPWAYEVSKALSTIVTYAIENLYISWSKTSVIRLFGIEFSIQYIWSSALSGTCIYRYLIYTRWRISFSKIEAKNIPAVTPI